MSESSFTLAQISPAVSSPFFCSFPHSSLAVLSYSHRGVLARQKKSRWIDSVEAEAKRGTQRCTRVRQLETGCFWRLIRLAQLFSPEQQKLIVRALCGVSGDSKTFFTTANPIKKRYEDSGRFVW